VGPVTDWQVFLQPQPSQTLDAIAEADQGLFVQVTLALTQLSDEAGDPLDQWGDLRSVAFTPTVTAEIFVNADASPPTIDVVRMVWLQPG
jgi:hypothetical protein